MNCRKGDLAVIVGVGVDNPVLGFVVRVEEFAGEVEFRTGTFVSWWVSGEGLINEEGKQVKKGRFPDCFLKPLRGEGKGEREGKKEKTPEGVWA